MDAAARETREETQLRDIKKIYSDTFMDVGYSFIKRLHKDRWRKHSAYPDGMSGGLHDHGVRVARVNTKYIYSRFCDEKC